MATAPYTRTPIKKPSVTNRALHKRSPPEPQVARTSSVRLPAMKRAALVVATAIGVVTCTDQPAAPPKAPPAAAHPSLSTGAGSIVLVGAGNIARCDAQNDEKTALILDTIPGTVMAIGDNVNGGTLTDFENCYGPTWGRHLSRTRPAPGDGDYLIPGAPGYFGYFGGAAGDPAKGYYSYDLGSWHIVVLNNRVPMGIGSAQDIWLKADLAATTQPCVLAYWHFPRFSSWSTGVRSEIKPFWDALYAAQADVVVNAHYRLYERFGPQTPDEQADSKLGIRQITVGTGGQGLDALGGLTNPRPNTEAHSLGTYGVLKLTLDATTYSWQYITTTGQVRDSGDGACHGRPGAPPLGNHAPTAVPGGPYTAEHTVPFDGSASRDIDQDIPLTYAWDFGDGTTGAGVSPNKSYAANGTYTATLVVTDALGKPSAPATTTVTIANVAPAVSAGPDVTIQIGTPFTIPATFTDQGGHGDGPWSWTVAWGDGTTSTGTVTTLGAPLDATHDYATWGEYTARVTIADGDLAAGSDEALIIVRDASSAAVLVGAGDIAECGASGSEETATLIDAIPGTVIAIGDNAYLSGTIEEYTNCYHPSWGRHKWRTKPAPGNHEYATPGAAGYFEYFGALAGDPSKGYYAFTAGEWLVLSLNSASGSANRSATSAQVTWLRNILATTNRKCAVAYMHHPHFTSADGRSSGEWNVIDLWNALYEGGVELVVAAHDHLYERFARMRPDGSLDNTFGIRQITVGSGGGEGLYNFGQIHPNSQVRRNSTFGVVKLTLRSSNYTWEYVRSGAPIGDQGSTSCHHRPGGDPPSNQAPTAYAGGTYMSENTVTFNSDGSGDPDNNTPLYYYWTFGDGTVGSGPTPTKTYTADGTYAANLVVTDALGRPSLASTATVTIGNLNPTALAGANQSVPLGTPFLMKASFTDPGGSTDAPWQWSINWGDGTTSTGSTNMLGGPINVEHDYQAVDVYTARLTVTDKDGASASDDVVITVNPSNFAPIAAPGAAQQGDQTVSFDGTASSDPDGDLPLTYAWDLGDGTFANTPTVTKTYDADGVYTVSLVVTDARGRASAPATTTATITNVAPSVDAGADASVQIGGLYTMSGAFTDPGGAPDAPWSWVIAWGDGTSSTGTTSATGQSITSTHTYPSAGLFTARLTVTDADGGSAFDEANVSIQGITLVGAGNIARCDQANDEKTATVLDGIPGTIFTTGDNIHVSSNVTGYENCFGPSWGRHKSRIRPSPGDLDYLSPNGPTGYFDYFGAAAAGTPTASYYSYDIASWHIIALNSSTSMSVGSAQELWLKADLAANTKPCILAYWHFPRFSSFGTAVRTEVKPLWDALYAAGADVVVNGHYRNYERSAPQSPAGVANANGIRQFVVGTGGHAADGALNVRPNSEVQKTGVYGVLKFTLEANGYSWQFVPVAGQTWTDTGSATCH